MAFWGVGLTGLGLADAAPSAPIGRGAQELFAQWCAGCHGADMRGAKVPSLLDADWREGGDDASLERVIRDGLPTAGMPAFGASLNAAERRALVVFIRETALRTAQPTPGRAEPLPRGVRRSQEQGWRIERVVEGFDVPWSLAFLPDGRLLVTDRVGTLHVVEGGRIGAPIRGTPPVWVRDEAGLMAVAVHPDHTDNGWVYLSFSDPGANDTAMLKIIRGRLRAGVWCDQETVFAAPPDVYTNNGTNFGGRLVFAGEYLFFTVGERGAVGRAQDLGAAHGKVHRIFADGRVPPDNPFVTTPGALGSIWSLGHRHPQGLALDPPTGALWATEHGPRGGDELNQVRRGRNYGWPLVTHGMNYDGTPVSAFTEREGLEPPARHWTPSIAVSQIHFYRGAAFPRWRGQLFLGSLAQQQLFLLTVADGQVTREELVFSRLGRIRDITTGPDGLVYVALETPGPHPGRIIRLRPATAPWAGRAGFKTKRGGGL